MNCDKTNFKMPSQSSKKAVENYIIQINNVDRMERKSEEVIFENNNDKINQISFSPRISLQDKKKNKIQSNIQSNNISHIEKPSIDKKNYLHIFNNIYLNDSHFTNNNILRNSLKGFNNTSKKFEKMKTFNCLKRNSKYYQKKFSSKKLIFCNNDIEFDNNFKKKSNILNNINEVKNNSNKNLINIKKTNSDTKNKKIKKEILSKFRSSKALSRFSNNNNFQNIMKNKSSKDLRKHNYMKNTGNKIIEEKNENKNYGKKKKNILELKKSKQKKKKKVKSKSVNANNQLSELIKNDTKNNSKKNNSKNIEIIKNEKCTDTKKCKYKIITNKLKSCLFCCFNIKEDSLCKD